jgi:hypothetical protein
MSVVTQALAKLLLQRLPGVRAGGCGEGGAGLLWGSG